MQSVNLNDLNGGDIKPMSEMEKLRQRTLLYSKKNKYQQSYKLNIIVIDSEVQSQYWHRMNYLGFKKTCNLWEKETSVRDRPLFSHFASSKTNKTKTPK